MCVDHTSKEPKESATTAMTAMQSLQSNERSVRLLLLPSQRSIDGLRSKEESDGYWRENNGTRKKMEPPANHTQNTNKTLATRFYTHT